MANYSRSRRKQRTKKALATIHPTIMKNVHDPAVREAIKSGGEAFQAIGRFIVHLSRFF
jgi:hypothetical protein